VALQPVAPLDLHDEVAHVVAGLLGLRPWKQRDEENVVVAFLAAKGMYEEDGSAPDMDALADLIAEADRDRPPPDVLRDRLVAVIAS
jgi:hypothetical protein